MVVESREDTWHIQVTLLSWRPETHSSFLLSPLLFPGEADPSFLARAEVSNSFLGFCLPFILLTIWSCLLWQDSLLSRDRCHPKLLDQTTKLTSLNTGSGAHCTGFVVERKLFVLPLLGHEYGVDESTSSCTMQHVENIYRSTKCGQGVWFHISERGASENWPPSALREEYLFSSYFKDRHKLSFYVKELLLYVLILHHAVGSISSSLSKFETNQKLLVAEWFVGVWLPLSAFDKVTLKINV